MAFPLRVMQTTMKMQRIIVEIKAVRALKNTSSTTRVSGNEKSLAVYSARYQSAGGCFQMFLQMPMV
jgi:hypothetical protein